VREEAIGDYSIGFFSPPGGKHMSPMEDGRLARQALREVKRVGRARTPASIDSPFSPQLFLAVRVASHGGLS